MIAKKFVLWHTMVISKKRLVCFVYKLKLGRMLARSIIIPKLFVGLGHYGRSNWSLFSRPVVESKVHVQTLALARPQQIAFMNTNVGMKT